MTVGVPREEEGCAEDGWVSEGVSCASLGRETHPEGILAQWTLVSE